MIMKKSLDCRDMGMECDVVLEGETDDEVMDKAREHAASAHNLTNLPPRLEAKCRETIKELEVKQNE